MRALLRQLRQTANRVAEYADTQIVADAITIGSAPDCHIQLLGHAVAPEHAVIRRSGSGLNVSARGGARITVNGAATSSSRLAPGDVVEIAGNRLSVLEQPPGFDAAFAVQQRADVSKSEFESGFRTELEQTWLSKRRTAWTLLLLVPLLAFAIPLATALLHRSGTVTPSWVADDTFWSAGPLTAAHAQAVGRKCEACHQQFFVHARDQDCRKCHDQVRDHVSPAHLALTKLGPPGRCGQCHEEHHAPGGSLIIRDDRLCVACHADAHGRFGSLEVQPVTGFAPSEHPGFMATVLEPPGSHEIERLGSISRGGGGDPEPQDWRPVRVPVLSGHEHSNLKFSHAQHLDGSRVQRTSDSKPLGCADCHTLAADGEHFAPIKMATACSRCHELTFDERSPERQLPHGKPRDAMLMIEDYYARRFSDPTMANAGPVRRRLPDSPVVDETCRDAPITCATRRAVFEITNQFTRRGCVSCHVVRDNGSADIHQRYEVQPVRLIGDYFTDTHFNHRLHAVQKDLTGDEACLSCHKARTTSESSVLMLPDIGKCLECHGDARARNRVTLQCASCHAYHSQS